jgi:hypothetical protein
MLLASHRIAHRMAGQRMESSRVESSRVAPGLAIREVQGVVADVARSVLHIRPDVLVVKDHAHVLERAVRVRLQELLPGGRVPTVPDRLVPYLLLREDKRRVAVRHRSAQADVGILLEREQEVAE